MVEKYGYRGDKHVDYASVRDGGHPQLLQRSTFHSQLETFINIAQSPYHVTPDTGVDQSTAIQHAIDSGPSGATYFLGAGNYQIGTTVSLKSDMTLWLDPGVHLEGISASAIGAVVTMAGSDTVTTATLFADCTAGLQGFPGSWSDYVAVDSTAAFAAGDWILLGDTQPPVEGTSVHQEVNRVRYLTAGVSATTNIGTDTFTTASPHGLAVGDIVVFTSIVDTTGISTATQYYVRAAGLTATAFTISTESGGLIVDLLTANGSVVMSDRLVLYYPAADTYLKTIGGIRKINIIENCRVTGGGKITNHGDHVNQGGHGLTINRAFNCSVDNIEVADWRNQAIGLQYTLGCRVVENNVHDASGFQLTANPTTPGIGSGSGQGIATTGAVSTLIANNNVTRSRHCIDVSYFSRSTTVSGNALHAGGFTMIQMHPHTIGTTVIGNTIDGARGYGGGDGAGGYFGPTDVNEMGDSGSGGATPPPSSAPGIAFREFNSQCLVEGNVVMNTYASGIQLNENDCEDIVIRNNIIINANIRNAVLNAGILAASSLSVDSPGLVIEGNTIIGARWAGIAVGYTNATVAGNTIREMTGTSQFGILTALREIGDVSGINIHDNTVDGGEYGVYIGGGSMTGNGTFTKCAVRNNYIYDTAKSAIFLDQSASVTSEEHVIEGNFILNGSAVAGGAGTEHGAITCIEQNGTGPDFQSVHIRGNFIWGECRNAIQIGLSDSVVEGNVIRSITQLGDPTSGFGIRIRAAVGSVVSRVRVIDNDIQRCVTVGIRVGSDSGAGDVEDCLIRRNIVTECGVGIQDLALCTGNRFENNGCYDSDETTSYGIYINSADARLYWNECSALTAATQDYGIFITATATGYVLKDNYCDGNGTAQIFEHGAACGTAVVPKAYALGSFLIQDGHFIVQGNRVTLGGTQTGVLEGDGQLVVV